MFKMDLEKVEEQEINTAGEDVTASYEITYANGTLEVTKNFRS